MQSNVAIGPHIAFYHQRVSNCLLKFCLLDDINKYTGQSDVANTIVSRRINFVYNVQHSLNVVVMNLATAML